MSSIGLIETARCRPLKCDNCGHEWTYLGNKKMYARCPECRYFVKIQNPIR